MTDFEVDEFGAIWLAGIVPNGWRGKNLNDPISGNEFFELWRSFTINTLGIAETNLDSDCWNWIQSALQDKPAVDRGEAGMLYVFAFLQKQLKLADYDSFNAGMANSSGRRSLYNSLISEYLDPSYNAYTAQYGGNVWGSELANITKDTFSGAPMFDVDESGYARLTDPLTYKEALQMLYRFSRSNRWLTTPTGTVSFSSAAAPIALTETQAAMASAMPLPTYANLPEWQGVWVTGDQGYDVKYSYEEDYRTLAEFGFNHLRYTVFASDLVSADHGHFNNQVLQTLDRAIRYGIQYGVHISLNIKISGDRETDVLVNWSNYAYLKEMYQALASRYQNVPSNALSFYLFFEPAVNDAYAAASPTDFITDARYAEICYELADVIWAIDPERFLSVDGITFGREPSTALANEGVARAAHPLPGLGTIAQSFHYFSTNVTWTNGFYGEAPSLPSWPLPYVQGSLYAGGPTITIHGNSAGFPAGTTVKVTKTQQGASPSFLSIDVANTQQVDSTSATFTLNAAVNSFTLSSTASGNSYNDIEAIWITYPFAAEQPIPIFGFFKDRTGSSLFTDEVGGDMMNFNTNVLPGLLNGMPLSSMLATLVRRFETRQIVVIRCGDDFLNMDDWGSVSTAVTVTDTYGYTSDSDWSFGPEFTDAFLQPWLAYEQTYHTETMLTEFAANNGSTENIIAAIIDEELSAMKANDIAWSGIAAFGNTNGAVFDDTIYDGGYQKQRTHWFDVARMDVLQNNMTTFEVTPIGRQTHTGKALTPALTVKFEGKPLIDGTDYTLAYFNNTDYGNAVIRVLGKGEYAGMSRTICFTISPFNASFALPGYELYLPLVRKAN